MRKIFKRKVMKHPKGFGKRYFSLTAIQAYAVAPKLHAISSAFVLYHTSHHPDGEEKEEDPPPELLEGTSCTLTQKPCHCNCYFRARTKLLLKLVRRIPKCNCKCRFFSFRRTGTHPPSALSF
jgi:hypothetical protein